VTPAKTTRPSRSTRAVVFCQRHPWWTSLVVAVLITAYGGPGIYNWWRGQAAPMLMTALLPVPAGFAFLAHAGRGGRTPMDRLAPWLAANVVALVAAVAFCDTRWWNVPWTAALLVTMPFAIWPLVAAVLLPGDPPGDETPVALIGYPAALVLLPPALAEVYGIADMWVVATALGLAIVPLAVHAVVRSPWPTVRVLAVATFLGFTSSVLQLWHLQYGVLDPVWFFAGGRKMPLLFPPAVWFAGALLAVAARRCRSMTAVPADHPIVEDFGAA
jgi:hypothetical protein